MRNTFFVHFWLLYSPFFGQRLKRLRACCFAPQEIYSEHSESSIETALIKIELVWIFTMAIRGKKHAELAQDLFPDFSSVWATIVWDSFAKGSPVLWTHLSGRDLPRRERIKFGTDLLRQPIRQGQIYRLRLG